MNLYEILDKKFDFKVLEDSSNVYEVETKIGDRIIQFTAEHWNTPENKHRWDVEFSEEVTRMVGKVQTVNRTHKLTRSGKEFEVFAFIKQCMENLIEKHHPDVIKFSADKESSKENRASLYQKMIKRFAKGYKVSTVKMDDNSQVKFTLEKI
jgi:hypothetical protein